MMQLDQQQPPPSDVCPRLSMVQVVVWVNNAWPEMPEYIMTNWHFWREGGRNGGKEPDWL